MLLDIEGTVCESDSQKNIFYSFNVPDGAKRLVVSFSYAPKTVEQPLEREKIIRAAAERYGASAEEYSDFQVKNLLTLSFDDPLGYRGACHRQSSSQSVEISQNSTPGIYNRVVLPGQWRVCISAHFVGCPVSYSLKIERKQ